MLSEIVTGKEGVVAALTGAWRRVDRANINNRATFIYASAIKGYGDND